MHYHKGFSLTRPRDAFTAKPICCTVYKACWCPIACFLMADCCCAVRDDQQPQGMYPFSREQRDMDVLGWLIKTFITSPSGETARLDFSPATGAILGLKGVFAFVIEDLWEVSRLGRCLRTLHAV